MAYGHGGLVWNNVKKKAHRPLESIILEPGVLDSIIQDAREFISMEQWYADAGIPHRRGYLLHGPPGTGKSIFILSSAHIPMLILFLRFHDLCLGWRAGNGNLFGISRSSLVSLYKPSGVRQTDNSKYIQRRRQLP